MRRRRKRGAATEFPIDLSTHGVVGADVRRYAEEKIARVGRLAPRPILFARAKLTEEANPAVERRAVAEASLDVEGHVVRAHVAAHEMRAAVDLLEERLRRRLEELSEHIEARRQESGTPLPGEWRHGDLPTARPDYYPRPVEERELVSHKTFADGSQTPEEAALDMRLLDFDFYLFTNIASGEDNVIYWRPEGGLGWTQTTPGADRPDGYALELHPDPAPPSAMEIDQAMQRLDVSGEPFIFFVNSQSGRGNVLYRRYDGHYGLITPADHETAVRG